jgi:hypothetical protein
MLNLLVALQYWISKANNSDIVDIWSLFYKDMLLKYKNNVLSFTFPTLLMTIHGFLTSLKTRYDIMW